MSDPDTKIVRIEWATIERHSGYFRVPTDFDPNDYDMGDAVAEHDDETNDGCERDDFEVYDTDWPVDMEEAIDLDLDGFSVG
ncbi:Uncharacterised protein [Mycobacteroides abscessus subsp. bolletii]|uniref:hypothetical protein n=1 Tax=Mycobacteroides abscessus TaxID=36809 RepID=UPI0009A8A0C0|nr:hypothetical protein [Mycobacteroides abscessus]SKX80988.1 Uncharacterised protein [Mycobacteroides abscessus subsp. bolletii]